MDTFGKQSQILWRFVLYGLGITSSFFFGSLLFLWVWGIVYDPSISVTLNRIGLILQFLSIMAVVPNLFDKEKLSEWEKGFKNIFEQTQHLLQDARKVHQGIHPEVLFESGPIKKINDVFKFIIILLFLPGAISTLASLRQNSVSPLFEDVCGATLFILIASFWMIIGLVSLRSKTRLPTFALYLYFFSNLLLTVSALLLSIPVIFSIAFIFPAIDWLAKQPIERALSRVTAPLLAIGSLLELISTFLK